MRQGKRATGCQAQAQGSRTGFPLSFSDSPVSEPADRTDAQHSTRSRQQSHLPFVRDPISDPGSEAYGADPFGR